MGWDNLEEKEEEPQLRQWSDERNISRKQIGIWESVSDLTLPIFFRIKARRNELDTFEVAKFCCCNTIIKIVLVFMTLAFKSDLS